MLYSMGMSGSQVVKLSLAQVAEIQDELYRIQDAVSDNPVASAQVYHLIKMLESSLYPRRAPETDMEDEYAQMTGLSTLIAQAQQQCQQ